MRSTLESAPVATALVVIAALVGGAVVILSAADVVHDPALRLGFHDYLQALFVGAGLLGIGRGLAKR